MRSIHTEQTETIKILNRDVIKYIALFTMLLNHIANIFLEPGTLIFTILIDIGYFTAPVMCYLLVEGYHYTRSKKKYAGRLALFALISEIPFCLAFSEVYTGARIISFCGFNMIFTLFLCFCILLVMDYVENSFLKILFTRNVHIKMTTISIAVNSIMGIIFTNLAERRTVSR